MAFMINCKNNELEVQSVFKHIKQNSHADNYLCLVRNWLKKKINNHNHFLTHQHQGVLSQYVLVFLLNTLPVHHNKHLCHLEDTL